MLLQGTRSWKKSFSVGLIKGYWTSAFYQKPTHQSQFLFLVTKSVVHDDAEFPQRPARRERLGHGLGEFIELVVHTFSLLEDEAAVSCDDNAFHRPISLATQGGRKLGGHFDRSRTSGSSESPSPADERHLVRKIDEQ